VKYGCTRMRRISHVRWISPTRQEGQILIQALDALHEKTGQSYGEMRSALVSSVYGGMGEPFAPPMCEWCKGPGIKRKNGSVICDACRAGFELPA
jgi:hypothetical protein